MTGWWLLYILPLPVMGKVLQISPTNDLFVEVGKIETILEIPYRDLLDTVSQVSDNLNLLANIQNKSLYDPRQGVTMFEDVRIKNLAQFCQPLYYRDRKLANYNGMFADVIKVSAKKITCHPQLGVTLTDDQCVKTYIKIN